MIKNVCGKTVKIENAYEIWKSKDGFTWYVLKKYQADDNREFARWFCFVTSPFAPEGEYGDTYVSDIKSYATKTS